jgi:hypothetical protein
MQYTNKDFLHWFSGFTDAEGNFLVIYYYIILLYNNKLVLLYFSK